MICSILFYQPLLLSRKVIRWKTQNWGGYLRRVMSCWVAAAAVAKTCCDWQTAVSFICVARSCHKHVAAAASLLAGGVLTSWEWPVNWTNLFGLRASIASYQVSLHHIGVSKPLIRTWRYLITFTATAAVHLTTAYIHIAAKTRIHRNSHSRQVTSWIAP